MTILIRVLFLLLVMSLGGCLPRDWARVTIERVDNNASITSELDGGSLYVFVTINGSRPLRMLVDTGSPVHCVSERVANELALVPTGEFFVRDAARNDFRRRTAHVASMRVGPLDLRDFDIVILPDEQDTRIDGTVGMLGLQEETLVLDFARGEIELSAIRLDKNDQGVMPFRTTHTRGVLVPFAMQTQSGKNREYWAILDTGNNSTLFLHPTATIECLDRNTLVYRSQALGVHGQTWDVEMYRTYGPVRIGDIDYCGVNVAANQASNNIGIGLLEGCRIVIDWKSRLIQVQRSDAAKRMVACESVGIFRMVYAPDGIRAFPVSGSVAEQQGLTSENVVFRVNGVVADDRFDGATLWPIEWERDEIVIEFLDTETGLMRTCVLPIK